MLELQGIGKRLGSFELAGLDLQVGSGEYFVLLGPSGVGKTILLELVAGLIRPDRGRINFNGRDITAMPPEQRGFSIVYQDYALFPHMTVERNIRYGMRRGTGSTWNVDEIATMAGISDLLRRRPGTLSGGEQQRVALARALAAQPGLLLLDEPLSAVDNQLRANLRRQLKQIHQQSGISVLHVTHDMDDALFLGQRIGVMLDGRIRQMGTPTELYQNPTDPQVSAFLGISNILRVDSSNGECCRAGGLVIHAPGTSDNAEFIWIRPEEIILSRQPFESSARNQLSCEVVDWEFQRNLVLVWVVASGQRLAAQITFGSFEKLVIDKGLKLMLTFKSSAVRRF